VRKPPTPLRFAPPGAISPERRAIDSAPGPDEGGLALWAHGVIVRGRLDLGDPLEIAPGSRLLVTGPNGCGKSTVLHVLAGDLVPDVGLVGRARGVRVGLLEQDVHLADDGRTPRRLLALAQGTAPDNAVAAHGLVAPRDLDRPLADLSVGQRRRVVLAMLVTQAPDVLLLDEPTNHISLALAEELMAALGDWPGAVVVASHDRWLRRGWTGAVREIEAVCSLA
jgi:macrolide transport system ATP-binding/permease protein